jgi:outer membrane protein OmpA-like peptidoglycan-associated protein
MNRNVLEMVLAGLDAPVRSTLGALLGRTGDELHTGLSRGVAAVLASVAQYVRQEPNTAVAVDNLARGTAVLDGQADAVAAAVAKDLGVPGDVGRSLLAQLKPLTLSVLQKETSAQKLGATGLIGLLNTQLPLLKAWLSPTVGQALAGGGGLEALLKPLQVQVPVATAHDSPVAAPVSGGARIWPWAAAVLSGVAFFGGLKHCSEHPVAQTQLDNRQAANAAPKIVPVSAAPTNFSEAPVATDPAAANAAVMIASDQTVTAADGSKPNPPEAAAPLVEAEVPLSQASNEPEVVFPFRASAHSLVADPLASLGAALADGKPASEAEFELPGVQFESAKDVLKETSTPELMRVAALLNEYSDVRLRVEGHTDSRGTAQRNLKLSADRAVAVMNFLIDQGIAEGRLEAKGYGAERPRVSNDTAEGRAQNRRVSLVVIE